MLFCHCLSMMSKLISKRKLRHVSRTKVIWFMFWNNMNLSLPTEFCLNNEAFGLSVRLQDSTELCAYLSSSLLSPNFLFRIWRLLGLAPGRLLTTSEILVLCLNKTKKQTKMHQLRRFKLTLHWPCQHKEIGSPH